VRSLPLYLEFETAVYRSMP